MCLKCLFRSAEAAEGLTFTPSFKPELVRARETEVHVRTQLAHAPDQAVAPPALLWCRVFILFNLFLSRQDILRKKKSNFQLRLGKRQDIFRKRTTEDTENVPVCMRVMLCGGHHPRLSGNTCSSQQSRSFITCFSSLICNHVPFSPDSFQTYFD